MTQRTKWIIAAVLGVIALIVVGRALWGGDDAEALAASGDPNDRIRAAILLADDEDDSRGLLRKLARDAEPAVSLQAINVMSRNPSAAHRRTLLDLAAEDQPASVRGAAVAALGNYEETRPAELASMLEGKRDPQVRIGAAKALARQGRFREKRTVTAPLLLDALRDDDPQVRLWAIAGIHHVSGHRFPGYDAHKPPHEQEGVIQFIRNKLRGKGLVP